MNNSSNNMSLDDSLLQSYAKLEALKAKQNQLQNPMPQQYQQPSTVFTDISAEFEGLSADETSFIVNSQDYQRLNAKYQTEFSQFLIGKFAGEYSQTENIRTLEEMLYTIRQKKEHYKQKFAEDINQIRDQNKNLVDTNNKLIENNQLLQEQLAAIQEKLKGVK
jgi:polyhydroxyalkanoate synthesis regulator phasin